MPRGALTLTGHLTTTDNTSIEEAMKDHITPVTGRNSFTPNIKFLWRFFSCQQSRYFTVEARSEQEARSMLPDAPCLFSARIHQGVNHA
ncbi:TPA: host cell division inhibitor Icd-like protein [Morganella morganii]